MNKTNEKHTKNKTNNQQQHEQKRYTKDTTTRYTGNTDKNNRKSTIINIIDTEYRE